MGSYCAYGIYLACTWGFRLGVPTKPLVVSQQKIGTPALEGRQGSVLEPPISGNLKLNPESPTAPGLIEI